ncbi:MAG TPA: hypothetical protein VI409_01195 [Gaiellaceae bacterium]|nr:hypothetical protein [Gaiellaceae bacterium]
MVAAADPGGLVGGGEQRVDLGLGEVGDQRAVEAFGRHREHALDDGGVLGVAQRGEAKQGVDRCEPGVAGADAVTALAFEVVEEGGDQGRVEIVEVELGWLGAGALLGEDEQQPQRVAVGGDRVRAGVPLPLQPVGEERLQGRSERAHGRPPR